MYPHRIRLRGPWECEPTGQPARRVTMPCRWPEAGLSGQRGLVRFSRKFGYPGRIDEVEHVWMTCAGCTGFREMHLNGAHLLLAERPTTAIPAGDDGPFAYEVTSLLNQRNRLEMLVQGDTDEAGVWGEVALEIRREAYLANVCLRPSERGVLVAGLIVGEAPGPLDLYVIVDGRHVMNHQVQPKPTGEPFGIDLEFATHLHDLVRVELVHVSKIWYAVELSIRSLS